MNSKIRQICLQAAMVMMLILAVPFQSFAATARIAFSDPSAQVGGEFDVTMKFTSTSGDVLGNTDVMLAYDAGVLEFVSGTGNVNGGNGAIRVTSGMEGKTEIATTLKFKALQAGTTQITVSSWEGYDQDGQVLAMDKQGTSTVKITAPEGASNDAALKSLQISPGTLNPAFSPDVENYTATVGLDTARVTVSALANSEKAVVSVEGGEELTEGDNTVACKVTAEDGTTVKTYTVTVTKAAGGETAAAGGETAGAGLETLAQLEGKTMLKIGIGALPEGVVAPVGLKETTVAIGDTKVQGWVPDTGESPEYCVFYAADENGNQGFYRYDMTDKTLQRYFEAGASDAGGQVDTAEVVEKYNNLVDDYKIMRAIAFACGGLAVLLLVVLVVMAVLSSRRNQNGGPGRGRQDAAPAPSGRPSGRAASRSHGGKKLTKEERYMMGEEDEYTEPDEDSTPEDNGPEKFREPEEFREPENDMDADGYGDPDRYAPEPADGDHGIKHVDDAEAVERSLAEQLAREASAATAQEEADPAEEDDFEVFDLDVDEVKPGR